MAIRWHMGFSGGEDARLVGQALQQYPWPLPLSVAIWRPRISWKMRRRNSCGKA